MLSLTAYGSNHSRVSATLLAAGTLLKGSPVFFLLYFVVYHRDLRYLVYFLESSAAVFAISLLVVPIQLYWVWLVNVFPTLFIGSNLPLDESVMGVLSISGLRYITPVVFSVGVCLFAVFAYRVRPKSLTKPASQSSVAADAMFLMNSVVLLLLGTRSWPQDYVWVILPTALFLSALLAERVNPFYLTVVCVAAFLFNFDNYPLFLYYLNQYVGYRWYDPMITTGLIGGLLMVPSLILLLERPGTALRLNGQQLTHNRLRR
jgi:hypothetical protein